MPKILNLSFSRIFVPAFVALLLSVSATVGYGNEPRQSRLLSRASHPFEPIEMVSIKVKGNPINFDEPLGSDKDWLQGLMIRVKNISEKPISYISIELWSYPPESGHIPRVTSFFRGSLPLPRNGVLEPPKTIVSPGEFIDITFTDEMYNIYKEYLQVSNLKVSVGKIFFMDDTLWMDGVIFTRDPDKPTRWKPVQSSVKSVEEFYLQKKTQSLVQPPGKLVNHIFPTAWPARP